MRDTQHSQFQLALVSMPWSVFNRPSIQLACLKAFLDTDTTIRTSLFHPYLAAAAAIGTTHYHHIAKNSWAGEALYSPILFPEQAPHAEKLFYKSCRTEKQLAHLDFDKCRHLLDDALNQWLATTDFSKFNLVGFSVCFNQLLSSLTAALRIKNLYPDLPIVIGGSGCVGSIGKSLLSNFHQIDFVINGEGEESLQQLCHFLNSSSKTSPLAPQVLRREKNSPIQCHPGIANINSLPIPNYVPYFQEMHQTFAGNQFVPVLPIEFSRGCWWNKCTFCNLNLQWHGYRWKTAKTMLKEVELQSTRHQCLDFCFTDNALPPKEADIFFKHLDSKQTDYDFFAEVRVITNPDTLQRYRKGGLLTIQVGIEALSNSLLHKMKKGTTVIKNIAAMRQSAEAGIVLEGNIITEFPGSTAEEVRETLHNLDFVLPYPPLSSASFFLGHDSPITNNPADFAIQAITKHPNNKKLIPKKTLANLDMLIKDYRGDRTLQRKQWQQVNAKIVKWKRFHEERSQTLPPLRYRDGKNFLLIRQEQPDGPPLQHRLHGSSREIYLYCCKIRKLQEIHLQFPKIKETTIRNFLLKLMKKKLIFSKNDCFLALAIKLGSSPPFPSA